MKPNQLFLCAVGRSGTTIYRTSLGLHPEIYYNDRENNIVQDILAVAQANCTSESRKFAMVVDQAEYDDIFRRAIQNLIWPNQQLAQRPIHMAAINPTGDQLDYLLQVFPGAQILCLVRNGIEVISSRIRYRSFANHSFASHCSVWNRSQSVFDWGQRNPDNFRLVRHEWLYDPERLQSELEILFRSLGIENSSLPATNILQQLRHPTDSDQVDFATMNNAEKTSYFQAKSNRWQQWSPEQREAFSENCGPFMRLLGYPMPWLNQ